MTTDLTRDRIMELKAGRFLDALVSIHVFGRDDVEIDWQAGVIFCDQDKRLPDDFSTRIQDAFKVVEKMRESGLEVTIDAAEVGEWFCCFSGKSAYAITAPLAIVKAALLAKLR